MRGIDAGSVPAQMINLQVVGEWADEMLVRPPMSFPILIPALELPVPAAIGAATPAPTLAFDNDVRPEANQDVIHALRALRRDRDHGERDHRTSRMTVTSSPSMRPVSAAERQREASSS